MTGPIDTAYVEIKPDTKGFTRETKRDVDRALTDVRKDVDRHASKIKSSLTSAFSAIGGAIRGAAAITLMITKLVALAAAAGAVSAALAGLASAIGGGIQSLIGLVQVAAQAAGALLLIPGAIAIVASAVATLKIGFSGVGAAFKEAGQAAGGGASQIEGAERRIMLAQREAKAAQEALTRARKDAQEQIEDLGRSLNGARLDEEAAIIALEDAQKALNAAQRSGDPDEIRRADLAYRQAQQTLEDVRDRVGDLADEKAEADKKGVEGSDAVQAALQRQADAAYNLDQAQKAATASAGGMASAMSKLAPNAQAFVRAVLAMKPAFDALRLSVQNALFANLGTEITRLGGSMLPVLQKGLTSIAKEMNTGIIAAFRELGSAASRADFSKIFASAATVFHNISAAIAPVIHALRDIATVGAEAVADLTGGLSGWADQFSKKISDMRASGELRQLIDDGITALKTLAGLLKDVLGIFGGLAKAAGSSDGLFGFFDKLNKLVNSAKGQTALSKIFESLGEIGEALLPVLAAVGEALVPVAKGIAAIAVAFAPTLVKLAGQLGGALASLAPAIIALAPAVESLGSVLTPLAKILVGLVVGAAPGIKALMDGLAKGLQALVPVAEPVGQALGAIAQVLGELIAAVGPILALLLRDIAHTLTGLGAVLAPLIQIFGQMVSEIANALIPVFNEMASTMLPLIIQLGKDFAESFKPLIPIIANMAKLLAAKLLTQLPKMVKFFEKLAPIVIDVGLALAELFLAALEEIVPILPDLIDLFFEMVDAVREILLAVLPVVPMFIDLLKAILPLITNHEILIPLVQAITLALQLQAQALIIIMPWIMRLLDFITDLLPAFRNLASPVSAVTGILSKVGDAFGIFGKKTKDGTGIASKAVSDSVEKIKGKLNPLGKIGETAGKAVGEGLIAGLKAKEASIGRLVGSIVGSVAAAAAAALDAHSPSRVFMELGKNTIEGYIIGLQKSTRGLRTAMTDIIAGDVNQVAGKTTVDQSVNFSENAINLRMGDTSPQTATALGMTAGRAINSQLVRRRNIAVAVRTA